MSTVDLPPPEGPTSAVILPGSATKRHAAQHRLVRPIGETARRRTRRAPSSTCSAGLSSSAGSVGGLSMISNSMRTPTRLAVEIDIEPRQPLGRLVGQQERGDEGEELAGRRADLDHAIAAIDHARSRSRSRRASPSAGSERLATRAILLASCSTAATLSSMRSRMCVFEREGLDDADALHASPAWSR